MDGRSSCEFSYRLIFRKMFTMVEVEFIASRVMIALYEFNDRLGVPLPKNYDIVIIVRVP